MGMVLLVSPETPDENSPFKVVVNGQFDVSHRYIPDLKVILNNLKMELGEPAKSQTITFVYKRFTVEFEGVELTFDPAKDLNNWVTAGEDNGLSRALKALEIECLKDPRIYRHSHLNDRQTGARFNVDWEDGISLQEDLNGLVERDIFDDTAQVLPYQVVIRARIRKAPSSLTPIPRAYLLEIYLENQVSRDDSKYYAVTRPYLLDSQFSSRIHGAKHHSLPHKLRPGEYRYQESNGVPGYGVTTSVEESTPGVYSTNAMPVSKLERIENPSPQDLGMSAGAKFELLAKDPAPVISELLVAIDRYVAEWKEKIESKKAAGQAEEASALEEDLEAFIAERDNVQAGLSLLEDNPDLMQCFQWMNGVMQRAIKRQGKTFDEWRLFQLGFILTQVRAIYERCCDKAELTDHIKHAEVLWFATGGGKTEAYLGILIMAMLFERKNEKLYGPTGWMRFPLRMLSVQQFQRLSYMVAEANMVRQNENLGGHPFTIGYFTGGGTPNSLTSTSGEQEQYFLPLMSDETLNKLKFISDCPYCDEPHTIKVVKNVDDLRIRHVCQNAKCWSNTEADPGRYGEGIRGEVGIYVSDPEVYRYLPTIMVGTVDKLATISLNHRFRGFFGQATHFCPTHGFSMTGACQHHNFEQEDRGEWAVKACPNNTRPKRGVPTKAVPAPPIPGISFMIQDELHFVRRQTIWDS